MSDAQQDRFVAMTRAGISVERDSPQDGRAANDSEVSVESSWNDAEPSQWPSYTEAEAAEMQAELAPLLSGSHAEDPSVTALDALRFQARLVLALSDAVIAADAQYRVVLINPAAAQMYGLDAAAVIGTPLIDVVQTEFTGSTKRAEIEAFLESGKWQGRVRQRGRTGKWMDVDATATFLYDDQGIQRGVLCLARDITRLREAERDAAERTAFAAAVLESLPGRTCVLSEAGKVIATNKRYREEGPSGAGAGTGPEVGDDYVGWLIDVLDEDATEDLRELLHGRCPDYRTEFGTVRRRRRQWTELFAVPLTGMETGGAVVTHVDITARKQAESALTRRATHDPLTGLPNRVLLADRLAHALSRADRSDRQVGLLFCDLDGFREVNNTFGHLAGDRLLVTIAKRLRAVCRSSDTVARVSGDEFVIILEDAESAEEVEEVAQRVIDALAEPVALQEGTARTGTSIGLVISDGVSRAGVRTVENMIRDADSAMYAAKEAGRGRYAWFTEEMRERPRERPKFVQAINRLLNR